MNSLSNSQTGGKCMCVIEHILKVFYKIEKFTKKKKQNKNTNLKLYVSMSK